MPCPKRMLCNPSLYKVYGLLHEMVLNYTIISMQRGTMIQHGRIVSKEYTKKGHHRNMQHTFIGRLCSRLWASPGVSLVHKSLCSAARMARTKVQRKKPPSAYCNVLRSSMCSI